MNDDDDDDDGEESKDDDGEGSQDDDDDDDYDDDDDDDDDDYVEESHTLWSEEGTGNDHEPPYSDWTIKIQSSDDDEGTLERTFHVHRMMFGSKSSYFQALFKGNFTENKVVTLAFPDVVVQNFDSFLEHCYTQDYFVHLQKRENFILEPVKCSVLLYLARYFGMTVLEQNCMIYIKNRGFRTIDNWGETFFIQGANFIDGESCIDREYYFYASQLDLQNLRQLMLKQCALYRGNLKPGSPLFNVIDVGFLIDVLPHKKEENEFRRIPFEWAKIIADICETRSFTLKQSDFNRLVDPAFRIEFDGDSALRLLKIQNEILCRNESVSVETELTDFEKRCLPAIHHLFLTDNLTQDAMPDFLPSRVLEELWRLAMWQNKNPWKRVKTLDAFESNNNSNMNLFQNRLYNKFVQKACGILFGTHAGKVIVVEKDYRCGPQADDPARGDFLFAIEGVVVDHGCPLQEVLQRIRKALHDGVNLTFVSDDEFKKHVDPYDSDWDRGNYI